MAERICPDINCHDKVEKAYVMAGNHEGTLYEKGGVKNQLEDIRLNIKIIESASIKKLYTKEAEEIYMKKPHWLFKVITLMLTLAFPIGLSITSFLLVVRDRTQASPYIYATKEDVGKEIINLKDNMNQHSASLQILKKDVDAKDAEVDNLKSDINEIKALINSTRVDFNVAIADQKEDSKSQTKEIKDLILFLHNKGGDTK